MQYFPTCQETFHCRFPNVFLTLSAPFVSRLQAWTEAESQTQNSHIVVFLTKCKCMYEHTKLCIMYTYTHMYMMRIHCYYVYVYMYIHMYDCLIGCWCWLCRKMEERETLSSLRVTNSDQFWAFCTRTAFWTTSRSGTFPPRRSRVYHQRGCKQKGSHQSLSDREDQLNRKTMAMIRYFTTTKSRITYSKKYVRLERGR